MFRRPISKGSFKRQVASSTISDKALTDPVITRALAAIAEIVRAVLEVETGVLPEPSRLLTSKPRRVYIGRRQRGCRVERGQGSPGCDW